MSKKVRINVTVDEVLLRKARKKLDLFGGKMSTLFNAFLTDFVKSSGEAPGREHEDLMRRVRELEKRVEKLGVAK